MKKNLSIALALTLSLLIAAAGPLSQTVRLVRADPHSADYNLVFSGAWMDAPAQAAKTPDSKAPQTPQPKPVQSLQALSGYWDTASAFKAPVADIPAEAPPLAPLPAIVSTPFCIALPAAQAPPSFIPSSRGPPLA